MSSLLKVNDKSDNYRVSKGMLDDLPLRQIICGPSGCSKTTYLVNFFCRKSPFYKNNFYGENIHIFSPAENDEKLNMIIKDKEVPAENIHKTYDDNKLNEIYDDMVKDYKIRVDAGKKPYLTVVLLDDLSFTGEYRAKKNNAIDRYICNARKHGGSILLSCQAWSQCSPVQRKNISSAMLYQMPASQLDLVERDINVYCSPSKFKKLFRDNVKTKYDFIYWCSSNAPDKQLLDKDFKPIDITPYLDDGF
jgi:hypothetical protein